MAHAIKLLTAIAMYTFILTSLFGAGLGLTFKETIEPLKNIKLVILALIGNFLLIPAAAYGITILLKADPSLQAGIMLLTCCAGAPFLPKLVIMGKGNLALGIGIMVLLMVATICLAPIILPLGIPGISVSPWNIARPLLFLMFLPLMIGLIINALYSNIAKAIKPSIDKIASISMLIWLVLTLILDYKILISAYGTGVYNAGILFALSAVLIGYVCGGTIPAERFVMTVGSTARNVAAALLVAVNNFTDSRVITVIMIGSLMQFIFVFMIARLNRRKAA